MNDRDRQDADSAGMRTAQAWLLGFVAGVAVLGAMGIAYVIGFNRGEDEGGGTGAEATATEAPKEETEPAAGPGKDLFVASCGSCHTLSAAETSGTAGPDLDALGPDDAQVLAAIENGGAGSGAMPSGLLEGEEAQQVAEFVGGSSGE